MLLFDEHLEDIIIRLLALGPKSTKQLIREILLYRKVTAQGVYKTLKKLKVQEIVAQNKKTLVLSRIWLERLHDFIDATNINYHNNEKHAHDITNLRDGEKVVFKFSSFEMLDIFGCHIFNVIVDPVPISSSLLIYHPHEIFLSSRNEIEKFILSKIKEDGREIMTLIGHRTELDKEYSRRFSNIHTRVFCLEKPLYANTNYYFDVCGDMILEIFFDKIILGEIHNLFLSSKYDSKFEEKLKLILFRKGNHKFTIQKNKKKAEKIRKIFKKYFV